MKAPRSPYGLVFAQAPARVRALVRGSEIGLVVLAALAGCGAGIAVAVMGLAAQTVREWLYGLPHGARLSATQDLSAPTLLLAPAAGGVLLGLLGLWLARWRGRRPHAVIDPIEANALHGGRMSVRGSGLVALQNTISNGSGASVGLEAGYTQIGAALASRLGRAFELRRSDQRTLVGCGAAAAIAAAFGAPLTGAFYAFELIIGTYSIATLTPVVVAALSGSVVAGALAARLPLVAVEGAEALATRPISAADTLPALGLGLACAALGIAIMRGVTLVEAGIRASRLPPPVAPALGGLCVGALAVAVSPQVLSGGHGALHLHLGDPATRLGVAGLALLFLAKAAASAISIGSGFRGGLFFASLFLGALAGGLFADLVPGLATFAPTSLAYAVIGMSALAVAVIGGPLTMTFLTLELTGSFPITGLVLVSVIASSLAVRKTFGYSFATWRFHLRGESIRSAHDVGWIRTLTVDTLMRREVATVPAAMPLAAFLADHPLGSPSRIVAVDEAGRYAGLIRVPEAHAAARDADGTIPTLASLLRQRGDVLTPDMNAKAAAAAFDRAESEALAVVDSLDTQRVVGLLTESHTLKRYSEELDRQRRAMLGETA
ncbi:chloride channel protein [Methylobacterium gossipiicola]|uniref:Chloride channel protein, CIC family n=1 Tax=Methylobacterium gossipiicola TaxID=582675 RepID=A0A1I2U3I8_9HYPH|nr:chloride channel protein [Methylobacterium gossipiicola]SFG70989.1 chloride channel protein, CIC family [Methylobacterium gossipiicola]